jgi:hypothetical protein
MEKCENPMDHWISESVRRKAETLLVGFHFRHFGVRHFGNPDDKELGHFALKTPKSRNATCPWSRVVVTEEATISEFDISAFQGLGG